MLKDYRGLFSEKSGKVNCSRTMRAKWMKAFKSACVFVIWLLYLDNERTTCCYKAQRFHYFSLVNLFAIAPSRAFVETMFESRGMPSIWNAHKGLTLNFHIAKPFLFPESTMIFQYRVIAVMKIFKHHKNNPRLEFIFIIISNFIR